MKLYLDDDMASTLLVRLLRAAGHQVLLPADFGLTGAKDAAHLHRSVLEEAAFLSHNYNDFKLLDDLVRDAHGHHFGILIGS